MTPAAEMKTLAAMARAMPGNEPFRRALQGCWRREKALASMTLAVLRGEVTLVDDAWRLVHRAQDQAHRASMLLAQLEQPPVEAVEVLSSVIGGLEAHAEHAALVYGELLGPDPDAAVRAAFLAASTSTPTED